MTDYKIVHTITQWGMSKKAKELGKDGWVAQGGLQKGFSFYYQAFVKTK